MVVLDDDGRAVAALGCGVVLDDDGMDVCCCCVLVVRGGVGWMSVGGGGRRNVIGGALPGAVVGCVGGAYGVVSWSSVL